MAEKVHVYVVRMWQILIFLARRKEPIVPAEAKTEMSYHSMIGCESAESFYGEIIMLIQKWLVAASVKADEAYINLETEDVNPEKLLNEDIFITITEEGIKLLDLDPSIERYGGGYSSDHTQKVLGRLINLVGQSSLQKKGGA